MQLESHFFLQTKIEFAIHMNLSCNYPVSKLATRITPFFCLNFARASIAFFLFTECLPGRQPAQRPESAAILEAGRRVVSASLHDEADQQIQLQSFAQGLVQQ